jgi:D-sedoheptulose 7-phosphate isomerase
MEETGRRLQDLAADTEFNARFTTAVGLLVDAFARHGRVFSCGNGGSMCDAMHFAEELTGRFREARPALAALAISDPSHLSCVGNDYGYEQVFARYLEAHARAGDVLIGLSTSGTSGNVIRAAEQMHLAGGKVVALTGRSDSPLGSLADVEVCAGTTGFADRAQEVHIVVLHSLIQAVEEALFAPSGAGRP